MNIDVVSKIYCDISKMVQIIERFSAFITRYKTVSEIFP